MAYTSVDGHVTRTHPKYISIEETITLNDGRSFPRYWQCWVNTDIPEGTLVNVKGNMGAKIAKDHMTGEDKLSKKGDRVIEYSLNDCTVTIVKALGTHTSEWGEPDPNGREYVAPTAPENAPF